jgi:hypothetical protein
LAGGPKVRDAAHGQATLLSGLVLVTKAWPAVGITYQINSRGLNSYKDAKTGHPLNWVEAQKLAEQRMGKQLNYSDWYWD